MMTASRAVESPRPQTAQALSHTSESPPALGPVAGRERIEVIDILRGVAVLGILMVNMGCFSLPDGLPGHQLWPSMVERTVEKLILFFAQEKFRTLFSFLFGLGLAVQMMRAEARGVRFLPFYLRRLGILFLIGVAHFLFLWDGDIVHNYAVDGCILLLFRRRSLRTLLVWAGIFLSIPLLYFALTTGYAITREVNPQIMKWNAFEDHPDEEQKLMQETRRIYSHGTYIETVKFRAPDLAGDTVPGIADSYILGIFLLGVYAGRRGIFHDVRAHLPFFRRVQGWGLVAGVAGNAAFTVGGAFDPSASSIMENVGRMCLVVGAPAMSCFYASTLILLAQGERWRRRLAPLAAVGRMALSNYLLQSLICTTIFYGYGLSLFCKLRPSLGLLLTVIICLMQVLLSVWWMRRFRFGPIEWMWRSLTYWERQPMRVSRRPSPVA